jgi:hypothetical protein
VPFNCISVLITAIGYFMMRPFKIRFGRPMDGRRKFRLREGYYRGYYGNSRDVSANSLGMREPFVELNPGEGDRILRKGLYDFLEGKHLLPKRGK